jgi:hypothetical protein
MSKKNRGKKRDRAYSPLESERATERAAAWQVKHHLTAKHRRHRGALNQRLIEEISKVL